MMKRAMKKTGFDIRASFCPRRKDSPGSRKAPGFLLCVLLYIEAPFSLIEVDPIFRPGLMEIKL